MMLEDKRYCCCFTGHRPEKLGAPEDVVISLLDAAICDALRDGYTTFISGVSKGVDLWAAELVLRHRQSAKGVKLVCAVPFQGFGLHWGGGWTERFLKVTQSADSVVYVCEAGSRSAYQRRNEYMVDRSSLLIAAYTGASGGTRNTVRYAEKRGECAIRYLWPLDGTKGFS